MPDLKLRRLPDRTPVKISFQATPELASGLQAYADLYQETYGQAEAFADLIPHMLECFLASDRAFVTAQKSRIAPGIAVSRSIMRVERSTGAGSSTSGE
ncbi:MULTISPECIES: DUF2274 domain-containing protein [unclassified Inquilinus]|uniref:DUF2274 domain-containing protein n=1 Tax=unclassified Inquilinus TaxID=2645927 RepID=UPI003F8F3B99